MQRDIKNADIDIETAEGAIWEMRILFIYLFIYYFFFFLSSRPILKCRNWFFF